MNLLGFEPYVQSLNEVFKLSQLDDFITRSIAGVEHLKEGDIFVLQFNQEFEKNLVFKRETSPLISSVLLVLNPVSLKCVIVLSLGDIAGDVFIEHHQDPLQLRALNFDFQSLEGFFELRRRDRLCLVPISNPEEGLRSEPFHLQLGCEGPHGCFLP